MSGALGVYLFLPVGLGSSPGRNTLYVKVVLGSARSKFPSLRILDFAFGLWLADAAGKHESLAAGMTGLMSLLNDMGVGYHTKRESGGGRPAPSRGWDPSRIRAKAQ